MSDERRSGMAEPSPAESGRLTRAQIIEAAVRITARTGADALTMRSLAEELGVTTMATYHYVKSKHELMAMIVDAAVAEIEIPTEGDWKARHRELTYRLNAVYQRYAHAMVVNLNLQATPAGRRLLRAARSILRDAGLHGDDLEAAAVFWQLYFIGRLVTAAGGIRPSSVNPGRKSKAPADAGRRRGWRESVLSDRYLEGALAMYYAGIERLLAAGNSNGTA